MCMYTGYIYTHKYKGKYIKWEKHQPQQQHIIVFNIILQMYWWGSSWELWICVCKQTVNMKKIYLHSCVAAVKSSKGENRCQKRERIWLEWQILGLYMAATHNVFSESHSLLCCSSHHETWRRQNTVDTSKVTVVFTDFSFLTQPFSQNLNSIHKVSLFVIVFSLSFSLYRWIKALYLSKWFS